MLFSEHAFRAQLKLWGCPPDKQLCARVESLWRKNKTQKQILAILNAEGYNLSNRDLTLLRQRLSLRMREPNGSNNYLVRSLTAAQSSPAALERFQQRLRESDLRLHARTRRVRSVPWNGLPADSLDRDPRFPSEKTISACKRELGLAGNRKDYMRMRNTFQRICNNHNLTNKTRDTALWQKVKDDLVQSLPGLKKTMSGYPRPRRGDPFYFSLDILCSDVAKRIRTIKTRMNSAQVKEILNMDPNSSGRIRRDFMHLLRHANFTSKLNAEPGVWDHLKRSLHSNSPHLQAVIPEAIWDPNDIRVRAFEVFCRDVTKRYRDKRLTKSGKGEGEDDAIRNLREAFRLPKPPVPSSSPTSFTASATLSPRHTTSPYTTTVPSRSIARPPAYVIPEKVTKNRYVSRQKVDQRQKADQRKPRAGGRSGRRASSSFATSSTAYDADTSSIPENANATSSQPFDRDVITANAPNIAPLDSRYAANHASFSGLNNSFYVPPAGSSVPNGGYRTTQPSNNVNYGLNPFGGSPNSSPYAWAANGQHLTADSFNTFGNGPFPLSNTPYHALPDPWATHNQHTTVGGSVPAHQGSDFGADPFYVLPDPVAASNDYLMSDPFITANYGSDLIGNDSTYVAPNDWVSSYGHATNGGGANSTNVEGHVDMTSYNGYNLADTLHEPYATTDEVLDDSEDFLRRFGTQSANPTVGNEPLDMDMDPFLGLGEEIDSLENPLGNIPDDEPMNSAVFEFLKDYPDDQAGEDEDFEYPDPTNYGF